MFMEYDYDDRDFPLAYLITFRCYGTWLHGDERGAIDRHGHNVYGTPRLAPNRKLQDLMRREMGRQPFLLSQEQREIVEAAIHEVCQHRGYELKAINARSNHVHVVVSAQSKPEPIRDAFKSYTTRKLCDAHLIGEQTRPWERGGSRRYLWKPHHVALAIEYVLYGQGDIIFNLED
jgi:REP element-mobilizing transposase RayT